MSKKRNAPDKVYIGLNQYGAVNSASEFEWNDSDNIKYIREDAIFNELNKIICESRTLPLSHNVSLIEKIIDRIKAL